MKQLQKDINNNPWFARYYDFDELDVVGLRDNKERENIYDCYDFTDKNILDVGCNLGKNFLHLSKKKAKNLIGVDLEYTVEVAKKIHNFYKTENVSFYATNLNSKDWYDDLVKKTGIDSYDFSLFVSVYGTKELYNRDNILVNLIKNTKDTLFFEGHHLENHTKYSKLFLKNNNIKNFEFYGYLRDKKEDFTSNIRPFFTIINKEISEKYIIDKIKKIQNNKGRVIVGIEGLAGSGKSFFLEKLKQELQTKASIFVDDLLGSDKHCYKSTNSLLKNILFKTINFIKLKCAIPPICKSLNSLLYNKTYDLIVISDYRLCKYIDFVDVLIRIECDENERNKRLQQREECCKGNYPSSYISSTKFSPDYFFTLKN